MNAQGAGAGFGLHICDVSVDRETGHVTIECYTAIQDVGKAIHPSYQGNRVKHEYSYLNPQSCGGPASKGILSAESVLS